MLQAIRKIGRHKPSKASAERRALPRNSAIVGRNTQFKAAGVSDPQIAISKNVEAGKRAGPELAAVIFGIVVEIVLPEVSNAVPITKNQAGGTATISDGQRAGLLFQAF